MRECTLISLSVILCIGCTQTDTSSHSDAPFRDADQRILDSEVINTMTDLQTVDADVVDQGEEDQAVIGDTGFASMDQGTPEVLPDAALSDSQVVSEADGGGVMAARGSRGQCARDEDCGAEGGENTSCSRVFPGGACIGCGQDDDCPDGSECSAFGACVSMCQDEYDCPAGTVCLGSGRCAQQRCNQGVCPDPRYDCNDSSRCQRRACSDGSDCDESMFCFDSLCVSNAWQ